MQLGRDGSAEIASVVLRLRVDHVPTGTVFLRNDDWQRLLAYEADRATDRTGDRWYRTDAWRVLCRLAKVAVPDKAHTLHPHDLRHAFVTLSLDTGASLRDVQDAAGHADPRTTRRYDRARHNLDKHPTYALAGLVT